MENPILTVKETASLLRISPSKTYQLINAGTLPCIQLGKRRLVPYKQLIQFLDTVYENGGIL